ncbi:prepilin-type N-terminal cleavage/methylation domain-containing protein [Microbacterium esteraromaticum]|uniref:Prepilin-type N-terminal cleavage/methylation domain-containing protein n=1 Tax=Microbacterium esteraromaticum TaxID=57043 RepID=A0A7D7W7X5_9MICO|nr:prepilin-type N-terminal cleavage/methylation domain-containing protein [Microbacterium esteraromaticum]QMU96535.1 prepilin-type N-terminal cleavage/methylation domain-containing protein [Microbacterium esteraromaticum]
MTVHPRDRLADDDSGLSLIELIVVLLLMGILGSLVVMIFINSWNTQRDVTTTSTATNEGQHFSLSVERAVRNAEAMSVSADGTQLLVRTTLGGAKTCQAFKLQPADIADPTKGDAAFITAGSSAPAWHGPTILHEVAPIGAAKYFARDGKIITYRFQVDTTSAPVTFDGEVTARNNLSEDGLTCWS